jgi:hypothetical protein
VGAARRLIGRDPEVVSDDGRLVLFDLEPLIGDIRDEATPSERRAARTALLRPLVVTWGDGFFPVEGDGSSSWFWGGRTGAITLDNRTSAPRRARVTFDLTTPGDNPQQVTMTFPDGSVRRVRTRANGRPRSVTITPVLPPGRSQIRLSTDAPDEAADVRDLHMKLADPVVQDASIPGLTRAIEDGN